jgi:hypothetical protein
MNQILVGDPVLLGQFFEIGHNFIFKTHRRTLLVLLQIGVGARLGEIVFTSHHKNLRIVVALSLLPFV